MIKYSAIMDRLKILPGSPWDMGAIYTGTGVNFCVFSRNATAVYLELFKNPDDSAPFRTIEFNPQTNRTGDLWHVFVSGLKPGALYLYRVDGSFDPQNGLRFNKKNYLYDPRAAALTDGSLFKNLNSQNVCPVAKMPKCVVVDNNSYDWEDDRPPAVPLNESVIYEMHLKGFTASPSSGVKFPGTYRGAIEKIPYLKKLGITAVELLPVQEFDPYENMNTNPKTGKRLVNYWGYSTTAFFAPKAAYSSDKRPGACVKEFKDMVKAFHKAGIEVILDIVFNHTAEGNEHGITFGFRGFDNSIYYHLSSSSKEYYVNFSGCGNAVNCNHPVVQDFIIGCLRYWVHQMHVDGFRFDLASVLARDEHGFLTGEAALTRRISEDPALRGVKIIAEPWDCGGAYQTGSFPGGRWCEWNDKFRDGIRRFIRGDEKLSTEAATRISGSSDLYSSSGRKPYHSINYIASHDGFTLNDLVSYNYRHNEQNGEENRDGTENNLSYNNGFEGPTLNPKIEKSRIRQIKNFFTALLLSQGTPMFVAGDEVQRTQGGNNNPYCQDNEISWFDWNDLKKHEDLFDFVRKLIELRRSHKVFMRTDFFNGQKTEGQGGLVDISWFNMEGLSPDWSKLDRFLAFRLGGGTAPDSQEPDNDFYLAFNTDIHDGTMTVPPPSAGKKWYRFLDTSIENSDCILESGREELLKNQEKYVILSGSAVVLISK